MMHAVSIVARNFSLPVDDFKKFCSQELVKKAFSLETYGEMVSVATSQAELLVGAYRKKDDLGLSGRLALSIHLDEHMKALRGIEYCNQALTSPETEAWEKKEYTSLKENYQMQAAEKELFIKMVFGLPVNKASVLL